MNTNHTLSSLLELAATEEGKQKIRVMVAELCGWAMVEQDVGEHPSYPFSQVIPDYAHSLDAMAEVEWTLTASQWENYIDNLESACGTDGWEILPTKERFTLVMASATQRAIALILSVGSSQSYYLASRSFITFSTSAPGVTPAAFAFALSFLAAFSLLSVMLMV